MFNTFNRHGLFEDVTDVDKRRRSKKMMRMLRVNGFAAARKEVKKWSSRKERHLGKAEAKFSM